MTKDASYKKVVRRHAEETGQRYTEALTDLRSLATRMHHEPDAERLLDFLRVCDGLNGFDARREGGINTRGTGWGQAAARRR